VAAVGGGAVAGEDFVGEPDERREATEVCLVQPDPDPVPGGKPGHHQQAHPLRHIRIRRRRILQLVVRIRQFLPGHPDAPVGDLDQGAARVQHVAGDMDRHICRRERRRVVDQLGQHVHGVVNGGPAHGDVGLDLE